MNRAGKPHRVTSPAQPSRWSASGGLLASAAAQHADERYWGSRLASKTLIAKQLLGATSHGVIPVCVVVGIRLDVGWR